MPETHAHGLSSRKSCANTSVRIWKTYFRAGYYRPTMKGKNKARRPQYFKGTDIATHIDTFNHTVSPTVST